MGKQAKHSKKVLALILALVLCCGSFSALAAESTAVLDGVDYSAVYDYDYYTARYPDVVSVLGNDPQVVLKHFVTYGMSEGRRGNGTFDVWSYRNKYPDLRQAFGNDLPSYYLHYMRYGKAEKRITTGVGVLQDPVTVLGGIDYSPVYDYQYYITNHPEVAAVYQGDDVGALTHFVEQGMAAGLQGCEDFNVYVYRARYADIRAAFGDDLAAIYQHYLKYGIREKRSGSGPMPEKEGVTVKDGIDYSAVYNYQYYIERYPDIKAAFGDDDVAVLDHFVRYGMNEQRQAIGSFNVVSYRNAYQDLRRAFGTNWKDYYLHYIKYGYKENRMTTGVATLQNPVTVYKQTDFSEIYDYYYYSSQHPKIAAALSYDDSLLLDYFVRNGLSSGQAGKASYDQAKYDEIKKKFPAYEYPKAAAVLAQVGKDLHSAFDWSKKLDYDRRGLPADGSPGTNYFAEYGFDHLYGNCYVYAATFVQMARLLGYDARQVSGGVMRPDESYADHSWVEIDEGDVTYVYDPEFEWQYGRDGFRMVYGQAERWVYKIYSYMTDEPEQK